MSRAATGRPYRVAPPKDELKKYINRGFTEQQIADDWGERTGYTPSRSSVGMAIARYNLKPRAPRPRYEDLIPDGIVSEHQKTYDAVCLRWLGRRRAKRRLKPDEKQRLAGWLRKLYENDAVVCYADFVEPKGWFWGNAAFRAEFEEKGWFVYDPRDLDEH